ncbi:MAG TPA: PEP-CTERM sorting domain-containing protein [Candidatus Limnocylindrales bacterium]|nr:PEP-CTERM sorting domain-containing protein [Candidatus Limnocylindrales bacterium]
MKKIFPVLLLLTLFILAGSYHVEAVPITPTDLDTVMPGSLFAGPITGSFINSSGNSIGSTTNTVYYNPNPGIYTYVEGVTPGVDSVSEFNTNFVPSGWNGVAGFSFSGANSAGVGSNNITITQNSNGTLSWNMNTNNFNSATSIDFFFQSTDPPGFNTYNLISSNTVGTSVSYAPVPEPATLLLVASGLAGMLGLGKKLLS